MITASIPPNVQILSQVDPADPTYRTDEAHVMRALASAEERHFWYRTRNRFISARLRELGVAPGARIIELGCGGGAVAAELARQGYKVIGVEGHLTRVADAATRAPRAEFVVHDLRLGCDVLPGEHDAVGMFDVLEHLVEPDVALANALRLARPGGYVVGTVPALQSLWSEVDVHAGHQVRHDARSLRRLLDAVPGAEVVQLRYFNRLLVPPLWLRRRATASGDAAAAQIADLQVPAPFWNGLASTCLLLEYAVASALDWLRVPGASLWFALRRKHP